MALRLYLDECSQSAELRDRLRAAGHDVVTASEAGLNHRPDGPSWPSPSRRAGSC
jgi:hypothetical protein